MHDILFSKLDLEQMRQLPERRRGRPAKDSHGSHETRQLLIFSGIDILTAQGFSATGIEQLLQRVGVPKGSFYHLFKSKEAYVLEVIKAYDEAFVRFLKSCFTAAERSPVQQLDDFVARAVDWIAHHEFRRGCIIGNLGQEVSHLPESLRAPIKQAFIGWEQVFAECFGRARAAGQLSTPLGDAQLANIFWIGWEGAVMRARLDQSDQALLSWYQWFRGSITAH